MFCCFVFLLVFFFFVSRKTSEFVLHLDGEKQSTTSQECLSALCNACLSCLAVSYTVWPLSLRREPPGVTFLPPGEGKVIFSVCPHPIQIRTGRTPGYLPHQGVPHFGGGTPSHVQGGYPMFGGYPMSGGVPHVWWGVPHIRPPHCTEQHSEHLLRGGRCASCVHAGGLSIIKLYFKQTDWLTVAQLWGDKSLC